MNTRPPKPHVSNPTESQGYLDGSQHVSTNHLMNTHSIVRCRASSLKPGHFEKFSEVQKSNRDDSRLISHRRVFSLGNDEEGFKENICQQKNYRKRGSPQIIKASHKINLSNRCEIDYRANSRESLTQRSNAQSVTSEMKFTCYAKKNLQEKVQKLLLEITCNQNLLKKSTHNIDRLYSQNVVNLNQFRRDVAAILDDWENFDVINLASSSLESRRQETEVKLLRGCLIPQDMSCKINELELPSRKEDLKAFQSYLDDTKLELRTAELEVSELKSLKLNPIELKPRFSEYRLEILKQLDRAINQSTQKIKSEENVFAFGSRQIFYRLQNRDQMEGKQILPNQRRAKLHLVQDSFVRQPVPNIIGRERLRTIDSGSYSSEEVEACTDFDVESDSEQSFIFPNLQELGEIDNLSLHDSYYPEENLTQESKQSSSTIRTLKTDHPSCRRERNESELSTLKVRKQQDKGYSESGGSSYKHPQASIEEGYRNQHEEASPFVDQDDFQEKNHSEDQWFAWHEPKQQHQNSTSCSREFTRVPYQKIFRVPKTSRENGSLESEDSIRCLDKNSSRSSNRSNEDKHLNFDSCVNPIKKFTVSREFFDKENCDHLQSSWGSQEANSFPKSIQLKGLEVTADIEDFGKLKIDDFKKKKLQTLIEGLQSSRTFSKDSTTLRPLLRISKQDSVPETKVLCDPKDGLAEQQYGLNQTGSQNFKQLNNYTHVPVLSVQLRKQNFKNIKSRLRELTKSTKTLSSPSNEQKQFNSDLTQNPNLLKPKSRSGFFSKEKYHKKRGKNSKMKKSSGPKKEMTNKDMKEIKKKAEDITFGMKNKNKSKKVQQVVKGMGASVKGGIDGFMAKQYQAKKEKAEEEKQQRLMMAVYASNKLKTADELTNMAENGEQEEVIELTFEEKIERDLAAVREAGNTLTKIDLENFKAWKERRMQRKAKELFEQRKEELKKHGHKRNLEGLKTGLELFRDNADLFKDDEGAAGEERTFDPSEIISKKHNIDDYALRMPELMEADHAKTGEITENKVDVDEDAFKNEDLGDDDDSDL